VGSGLQRHVPAILGHFRGLGVRTVLDYGSGRGWHVGLLEGMTVTCYDPAYPPLEELPNEVYDGVCCVEVLEHVPEEELTDTLMAIYVRAQKAVFLTISVVEANARLPNGENAHCTVQPPEWWDERLKNFRALVPTMIVYTKNGVPIRS